MRDNDEQPSVSFVSRRSEETKKNLCRSLKKLLGTGNHKEIDIAMIARESGITRKSFYYHFSCRDELMIYALELDIKRIREKIENGTAQGWDALLMTCRYIYHDKAFYKSIVSPELFYSASTSISLLFCPILRKSAGEIFGLSEENECCMLAADSIWGAIVRWIASEYPAEPDIFLGRYRKQALSYAKECIAHMKT